MIKQTVVASASLALVTMAVACAPPPPPDQTLTGSTTTMTAQTAAPTSSTTTSSTTTSSTTTTSTTTTSTTTTIPEATALYSPTPIDGWGIVKTANGPEFVDVVQISGGAAYVGGTFANAVKHSLTAPRANLMAVDLASGDLLPFVADTNGAVTAIASDGTSLFIGGDFTTVNGVPRSRLAKLDLTTGAVDPLFNASTGNTVHDLLVLGGKLYLVGAFTSVDGTPRLRAAAVNTTDGSIDPTFDPTAASGTLFTLAANANGTKLYLGGAAVAGVDGVLVEVDPTTGAVQGPTFADVNEKVEDLEISPDGEHVYAGVKFNSAVDWSPTTGKRTVLQRANGDVQAVAYSNGYLYMGFHDGFQNDVTLRLLALDPRSSPPGAVVPSFQPASNSFPGVFTLDANGDYLVGGGYFSTMGGVGVRGVAIFPKV